MKKNLTESKKVKIINPLSHYFGAEGYARNWHVSVFSGQEKYYLVTFPFHNVDHIYDDTELEFIDE